ncbi:endonuclease/exonuclease/phosphatase family protein [Acrocarpospora catenulata]|uniref:endonuclease/exonuclease/phosphatase family protein n=1 Tax=Acrocarpospora catenulata TaxID=2836182 RepID=UPI001BD9791E|nr:endonuclease/exonuclease/phosphatase family protein [Acrocarpospora catenulata]
MEAVAFGVPLAVVGTALEDPPITATAAPRSRLVPALWVLLVPFAGWAVLRLTGAEPKFRWSQAVSFTPYVAGAALLPLLLATAMRRWQLAVAWLVVAGLFAVIVLPRALPDGNPEVSGPRIRVMALNAFNGTVDADALMSAIRSIRPDVLALLEYAPWLADSLEERGIREVLPYRVGEPMEDAWGSAVFSRHPLRPGERPIPGDGPAQIPAVVTLPGGLELDVVAVHACAPSSGWRVECWAPSIRALPPAGGRLRILAGDFNSSLDHAVLRELIATGYRDAADVAGKGLTMTWPYYEQPRVFPKVAIDHVLADERIAVLGFEAFALPHCDHRATLTELALPEMGRS